MTYTGVTDGDVDSTLSMDCTDQHIYDLNVIHKCATHAANATCTHCRCAQSVPRAALISMRYHKTWIALRDTQQTRGQGVCTDLKIRTTSRSSNERLHHDQSRQWLAIITVFMHRQVTKVAYCDMTLIHYVYKHT